MINLIVITDQNLGMADDHGIPWPPVDQDYFRQKTSGHPTIMGYRTYQEFEKPLPNRQNLVVCRPGSSLRPGFDAIEDLDAYLETHANEELWIIGGAALFAQTIDRADNIYITRIDSSFACTKFFPNFEDQYQMTSKSPDQQKSGLTFHFEVWHRK